MESDIVSGQQSAWVLLKKLGEGDAGEVYLVESLLEKQVAILKRPSKSAFASDMIRQTAQITNEAKILKALSAYLDLEPGVGVRVPHLIDQSRPGTTFSDRLFIIIERAEGFDLSMLARTERMGSLSGTEISAEQSDEKRFLQTLAQHGAPASFSNRILLNILNNLFEMFSRIHNQGFDIDGIPAAGILWNDVKPEHLYWDPLRTKLTVIDWGNGQFLERDGATRDRRFTPLDDYRQLLEAFGGFMQTSAPHLLRQLDWPASALPHEITPELIQNLRERVWEALQKELEGLNDARRRELELLRSTGQPDSVSKYPLKELESIHQQIISYGELPDYAGSLYFAMDHATRFAQQGLMEEVQEICEWANGLPGCDPDSLRLCATLARMASRSLDKTQRAALSQSVKDALAQDWPGVLWNLVSALRGSPEPDWWHELVNRVRQQALGEQAGEVQPLMIARRTLLTLVAALEKLHDQGGPSGDPTVLRLQALVKHLREEIVPSWMHIDPAPPFSNLAYSDIDEILDEIGIFLPDARYNLDLALESPRRQVLLVLQDWERGQFEAASQNLRQVLLWDPDRKRVLRAEQALKDTPAWLAKVHAGPQNDEHYRHFVTEIEYEGRELRNHIGPAAWLDLILEGCRQLRKGAWPPDLFASLPLLVLEMPWLARFERHEKLPAHIALANAPEGETPPENSVQAITPPLQVGVLKGKLGLEQDLHLSGPLDAWIAEARGSSARVFNGQLRSPQGESVPAAIKLMRMDKVDYSLPLFREEVIVLNAMCDVPGVTPLLECGFLQMEGENHLPTEREGGLDDSLAGSVIRIGPKSAHEFDYQIENRIAEGWTPYLAIQLRDWHDNLLNLCDSGLTGGSYRPVSDLLQISIQICDILAEAHRRNIVYRDHKILHYYWIESTRGVYMIDWNVARLHPDGLSEIEKQMDLVQFGARALHHILTGRTAPGALPLGPTRPEEIEQAAKSYEAQWTYDDQRLPEELRGIIEKTLGGQYTSASALGDDLKQCFLTLQE